ncbi:MAG: preprotein translocase subunit YajC [candidate division Zixibacteria bacterium 4484_95]|nr:MAG: preprotein translocase subunit YajC [candidate division Zixibacteria bacterium 4484_95]
MHFIAMAQPGGGGGGGSPLSFFVPILLIFLIMYFLMIRPQQKKQKQHQAMLSVLKKGDKVVTNSGMFGTVWGINDKENKVILKFGDDLKIEFLKSSIAGKVDKD